MRLLPKIRTRKSGAKRTEPTFVSPYPIVNELMALDPADAGLHEMEMEMWTDEEFRAAFDTRMSHEETVNFVWNNAWDHMAAEWRRVLQAKIDKLPPEARRKLLNHFE